VLGLVGVKVVFFLGAPPPPPHTHTPLPHPTPTWRYLNGGPDSRFQRGNSVELSSQLSPTHSYTIERQCLMSQAIKHLQPSVTFRFVFKQQMQESSRFSMASDLINASSLEIQLYQQTWLFLPCLATE